MIDRFEGGVAVCEAPSGRTYAISRGDLPANAREGDVVVCLGEGRFELDAQATERRAERIRALHERLFGR